jgi:hypothetical protein
MCRDGMAGMAGWMRATECYSEWMVTDPTTTDQSTLKLLYIHLQPFHPSLVLVTLHSSIPPLIHHQSTPIPIPRMLHA